MLERKLCLTKAAVNNFFGKSAGKLAHAAMTKSSPLYVQFYVTARCNLTCEQCNVIYANADQEEVTTEQAFRIADNLSEIGTSIVLLTGGEPFVRKDLTDIAKYFKSVGIHPRIQTNGLAKPEQIEDLAASGIHDISISLDSLLPDTQDKVNGGYNNSWLRAIKAISTVNKYMPDETFASFGCVLAPTNLMHVESVIEFATKIGWWVSLVPAHVSTRDAPRSFSSFDVDLRFTPESYPEVKRVLERVVKLKRDGYNVYDSEEYIKNIYKFVTGEPLDWRRRNGGVCDSPNLYFAIQPNGDMGVCCDYRLPYSVSTYEDSFPDHYHNRMLRQDVYDIAKDCSGCMYGSFPEITITARYYEAMLQRAATFLVSKKNSQNKGFFRGSVDDFVALAGDIAHKHGLEQ